MKKIMKIEIKETEKKRLRRELIEILDDTINTFLTLPEIKKCRREIEGKRVEGIKNEHH